MAAPGLINHLTGWKLHDGLSQGGAQPPTALEIRRGKPESSRARANWSDVAGRPPGAARRDVPAVAPVVANPQCALPWVTRGRTDMIMIICGAMPGS